MGHTFRTRVRAGLSAAVGATLAAIGPATPAGAMSDLARVVIDEAREDCASIGGGVFSTDGKAVVVDVDLTGDGVADEIVDQGRFHCSTAASFWCGTGGCGLIVIAEGTAIPLLAKDWRVVEWHGHAILLIAVHGSSCGGTNLRACYEALVWSEGALRGVGAWRKGE